MEAVIKPEPVWLLEDQAVLDGMKREGEEIAFPDIKDEFLNADVQDFRRGIFQNDVGIKKEEPISDNGNEEMKIEFDFEEHNILEQRSEYIPRRKRSGITGTQQCGEINTEKPEPTVTKRMKRRTGDKPFKCELCNKGFTENSKLACHIRVHTGDKPFKCKMCSKCFTQRGTLTDHIRIHTGDKPFKCDVCYKNFNHRSSLRNHVKTHTGEKHFVCEFCSKCFTQQAHLKDHIRTHTGEKPFKCEVCSKCFTHLSNLTDHRRSHTGDKPFKCEFCSKSFTRRTNLTKHIRMHVQ